MGLLGTSKSDPTEPLSGAAYLQTLHKYLVRNLPRLAPSLPSKSPDASLLQQSYTLLTLGLDPNSAPLSRSVKVPLTLGFGTPSPGKPIPLKPLLLRLPPDKLLYLLLRWQSLPVSLPHVGRTDEPIEHGVPVAARGARVDNRERRSDGDVQSVSSWVGSMRSVSLGSMATTRRLPGFGWMGKKQEINEDQILLGLYEMFTVMPALLIHLPFLSDRPIAELIDAGGYTQLGGIDVRVPLDVLRNLQILELEGYDPRGLLIPPNPGLRSLTVRDVQDADDWLEELLVATPDPVDIESPDQDTDMPRPKPRFPNLRHLCLYSTTLLNFPTLPLTSLTHLDLSHNLLNALPTSLASLSTLQSLNLSNNLITSLRNAPSVMGNITSLNISKNRIDCLIGLERVLGLERIDVRGNELAQWDEVGRLSVLPYIKEVWCSGNSFDRPEYDEWRIELGVAFAREDKAQVVFDDAPWSWNETRRIELLLAQRGHAYKPQHRSSSSNDWPQHHHSHVPPAGSTSSPIPPRLQPSPSPQPPTTSSSIPPPSPAHTPIPQKKRRPRRVINLDGEASSNADLAAGAPPGGSLRLAKGTVVDQDLNEQNGQNPQVKERRRISVSLPES